MSAVVMETGGGEGGLGMVRAARKAQGVQRLFEVFVRNQRERLEESLRQQRVPLARFLLVVVFYQWKFWLSRIHARERSAAMNLWALFERRYETWSMLQRCRAMKTWQNRVNFERFSMAQADIHAIWNRDRDLDSMFRGLMLDAREILSADRATLFLVDPEENVLLSKIALGTGDPIQVQMGKGIVGHVATSGRMLNIEDAIRDPRFNSAVDKMTGYTTRTILCAPVISEGVIIGALQLINKLGSTFTTDDENMIEEFCAHISTTALLVDVESDFTKITNSLEEWRRDFLILQKRRLSLRRLVARTETESVRRVARGAFKKWQLRATMGRAEGRTTQAEAALRAHALSLQALALSLRRRRAVAEAATLGRTLHRWRERTRGWRLSRWVALWHRQRVVCTAQALGAWRARAVSVAAAEARAADGMAVDQREAEACQVELNLRLRLLLRALGRHWTGYVRAVAWRRWNRRTVRAARAVALLRTFGRNYVGHVRSVAWRRWVGATVRCAKAAAAAQAGAVLSALRAECEAATRSAVQAAEQAAAEDLARMTAQADERCEAAAVAATAAMEAKAKAERGATLADVQNLVFARLTATKERLEALRSLRARQASLKRGAAPSR